MRNSLTPQQVSQLLPQLLEEVCELAIGAGECILKIYHQTEAIDIAQKADQSPVTEADLAAHAYIVEGLRSLPVPVISEEGDLPDYDQRQQWPLYWLVDPLDGTKEFINRNGEFTVNIALIAEGRAVLGVVYVPVSQCLYRAINMPEQRYAHRYDLAQKNPEAELLKVRDLRNSLHSQAPLQLVCSRHHGLDALAHLVARIREELAEVECVSLGSSLKLCKVAAGEADCYPRLGLTSEWDTAAAQAIVEAAGGQVLNPQLMPLTYNQKASILNPSFCVVANNPTDLQGDKSLERWFTILVEFYAEFAS